MQLNYLLNKLESLLGRFSVKMRIFAKTLPNAQWEVERRIRLLIKEEFDLAGVKFFDRDVIISTNDFTTGGDANG